MAIANAVLVYTQDGEVKQRFCNSTEAQTEFERLSAAGEGCSMFATETDEAELLISISPDFRARVDAAKEKLRVDLRIQQALDLHGVPADRELRARIHLAFVQLQSRSSPGIHH